MTSSDTFTEMWVVGLRLWLAEESGAQFSPVRHVCASTVRLPTSRGSACKRERERGRERERERGGEGGREGGSFRSGIVLMGPHLHNIAICRAYGQARKGRIYGSAASCARNRSPRLDGGGFCVALSLSLSRALTLSLPPPLSLSRVRALTLSLSLSVSLSLSLSLSLFVRARAGGLTRTSRARERGRWQQCSRGACTKPRATTNQMVPTISEP